MKDEVEVHVELPGEDDDRETLNHEIDILHSFEMRLKGSIQVSKKVLDKLGMEKYIPLIDKHKIGIEALMHLGHDGLAEIGIKNSVDRATILAAGDAGFITADPPKIDGKPVEVRLKLGFARLARINTVDLTCDVKLFIDLYWNDPNMVGVDPENVPTYVWRPNAYIYNSIDGTGANGGKVTEHQVSLMNTETGLMLYPLELEVTLSNEMDLRKFPFDSDAVDIIILQSEDGNADDWVLRQHESVENSVQFFYNVFETAEWDVNGFSLDFFEQMGGNGVMYTHCIASIHIQRRPLFYIWKLVLPLFLTTGFAFGSFFFEVTELEARSNAAATTLLTTVALIYVLSNELPKTNYQTLIDWYLVFCLGVQLIVWIISNFLATKLFNAESVEDLDLKCGASIASIFGIGTVGLFLPKLLKWSRSSKFNPPPYKLVGRQGNALDYYALERNKNVWY